MSTKNSSKKANVQTEKNVINLDEILKKAESAVIKEKSINLSRASLYKYSEEETKEILIDKDKGKKIRNKIRKQTDRFMSTILGQARRNETENLSKTISEFKEFYSKRFLRNDFTLSSLREEKALNENDRLIFSSALEIVKAHL